MLTAKGKYGLKALVYLASRPPGETTQATDIAEATNIPKKFLDAILGELRNAGIVYSKKGPGGGYVLARAPDDIQIGQAIRTLDGPLAPIACASRTAFHPCGDCKDIKACAVRLTMTKVRDAISEILDRMTIADMLRDAQQAEGRPAARPIKRPAGRGLTARADGPRRR
jgi:Rrf2 family protein